MPLAFTQEDFLVSIMKQSGFKLFLHFLRKTPHKQLTARFQFLEEYPQTPITIELVSRIMSDKLLDGLTKVCEEEAKKLLGQRQVLCKSSFSNVQSQRKGNEIQTIHASKLNCGVNSLKVKNSRFHDLVETVHQNQYGNGFLSDSTNCHFYPKIHRW